MNKEWFELFIVVYENLVFNNTHHHIFKSNFGYSFDLIKWNNYKLTFFKSLVVMTNGI